MARNTSSPTNDHDGSRTDGGIAVIQTFVWIMTFGLTLMSMYEFIEPDAGGFSVNLKRLVTALSITIGGYGVSRLAIVRGAPLAAAGSVAALAASALTFAVLTPTIIVLSFMALSGPEVRKQDAQEKCPAIRLTASQLDEVSLARASIERTIKVIKSDTDRRFVAERDKGRETGNASVKGRPQPIANLYQDAHSASAEAEDLLARGSRDRGSAVRDIATLADDCERAAADPRKWRKDGSATVSALYDRAGARIRELGQAAPLSAARNLVDQLRDLSAKTGNTGNAKLDEARGIVRAHADRLDKELAGLPRMPEGLPPLTATPLLVSAFEPSKFAAVWHNGLIALLVEGGSPLLWTYAFVRAKRRQRSDDQSDRDANDHDDPSPPRPNGRGRP